MDPSSGGLAAKNTTEVVHRERDSRKYAELTMKQLGSERWLNCMDHAKAECKKLERIAEAPSSTPENPVWVYKYYYNTGSSDDVVNDKAEVQQTAETDSVSFADARDAMRAGRSGASSFFNVADADLEPDRKKHRTEAFAQHDGQLAADGVKGNQDDAERDTDKEVKPDAKLEGGNGEHDSTTGGDGNEDDPDAAQTLEDD